jgi:hypothetical protein
MKKNWIENQNGGNMLYYLFYMEKFLFLKKTKILIFNGISKYCLWAVFGKILQFWAEFGALVVADSMPELRLKSLKPHNF